MTGFSLIFIISMDSAQ